MRTLVCSLLFLAALAPGYGQSASSSPSLSDSVARLPVTRGILYKNGVGYFEHAGQVRGNQEVNVDFTTAQLNDVLKSLTVLDLGKGRITGVSYNSVAPLSRQLGALPPADRGRRHGRSVHCGLARRAPGGPERHGFGNRQAIERR